MKPIQHIWLMLTGKYYIIRYKTKKYENPTNETKGEIVDRAYCFINEEEQEIVWLQLSNSANLFGFLTALLFTIYLRSRQLTTKKEDRYEYSTELYRNIPYLQKINILML